MKNQAAESTDEVASVASAPSSRVVYTQAPVVLGLVERVLDRRAEIRSGGMTTWVDIDASVDPALLLEAKARGARVVLDMSAGGCVVGVLMTARTLEIDRDGNLQAEVKKLVLHAQEALIQTPQSFLRLRERTAELLSDDLIVRGRTLTRIFGRMIKLN